MGQETFYYSQGIRIGMVPIMNAKVITETQAFEILFNLSAHLVGAGGVNGSEGSVIIVAEGEGRSGWGDPVDRIHQRRVPSSGPEIPVHQLPPDHPEFARQPGSAICQERD